MSDNEKSEKLSREEVAAMFDDIPKREFSSVKKEKKDDGRHFISVTTLQPGLYAGILRETGTRTSQQYGPQIRVVVELVAKVSREKQDIEYWEDFGCISCLFSLKKKEKIANLVAVYDHVGALKDDGSPLQNGGDLLRCKTPQKMVNVVILMSDKTQQPFFWAINAPYYQYNRELSEAPSKPHDASAQPAAKGGSSYLSDVPPF